LARWVGKAFILWIRRWKAACILGKVQRREARQNSTISAERISQNSLVARALRDPDESVRDWKNCRKPYFSDFVCSAIRESGFVGPVVAQYAIAALLMERS
jgi:hypothetical protein